MAEALGLPLADSSHYVEAPLQLKLLFQNIFGAAPRHPKSLKISSLMLSVIILNYINSVKESTKPSQTEHKYIQCNKYRHTMSTAVESNHESLKPLTAEQAFDSVGPAYEAAFADLPEQSQSIKWLLSQLGSSGIKPAKFLDIGCGTGRPVCSSIADAGHDVLGIDVSSAMINAARERVPNARFQQMDFRNFNPPQQSLDAASVYFSLIADVTQEEIKKFIAKIYGLLKPGGLFVFATLPLDVQGLQIKWMGRPLTVSSLEYEVALGLIRHVGFEVVYDAVTKFTPKAAEAGICQKEDVWEEPHLFVYARKPSIS